MPIASMNSKFIRDTGGPCPVSTSVHNHVLLYSHYACCSIIHIIKINASHTNLQCRNFIVNVMVMQPNISVT